VRALALCNRLQRGALGWEQDMRDKYRAVHLVHLGYFSLWFCSAHRKQRLQVMLRVHTSSHMDGVRSCACACTISEAIGGRKILYIF
jgi:hypothetical protein